MRELRIDNYQKCEYTTGNTQKCEKGGRNAVVNVELLKSAMQDKSVTIEQASMAIGVNPATFYRRFNQKGEKFTVGEVSKLAELLNLDSDSVNTIFFGRKLA